MHIINSNNRNKICIIKIMNIGCVTSNKWKWGNKMEIQATTLKGSK